MRCPKCNTELAPGNVFCPKCGHEVQMVPDYDPLDEMLWDQEEKKQEKRVGVLKEKSCWRTGSGRIPFIVMLFSWFLVLWSAQGLPLGRIIWS